MKLQIGLPGRALCAAAIALALGGLSAASPGQARDFNPTGSCAVLFGGGGMLTGDQQADGLWFRMNEAVSNAAATRLSEMGYGVDPYIIDDKTAKGRSDALLIEMNRTNCRQVIQISHALRADPSNPKVANRFAFTVSVLHFEAAAPGAGQARAVVRAIGDYEKSYEFPLTEETLETLSLSGVGEQIAADLDSAKVLSKSKPAGG